MTTYDRLETKKEEDYPGYEGKGILEGNQNISCYNGLCLGNWWKTDYVLTHPPYPFELWLYCGHTIKNDDDLFIALENNQTEGSRRQRNRI